MVSPSQPGGDRFTATGRIDSVDQTDWYAIDASEGDLVTASLSVIGAGPLAVAIVDPDDELVTPVRTVADGDERQVQTIADTSGSYAVAVGSGGGTGVYELTVRIPGQASDLGADAEHVSPEDARRIGCEGAVAGIEEAIEDGASVTDAQARAAASSAAVAAGEMVRDLGPFRHGLTAEQIRAAARGSAYGGPSSAQHQDADPVAIGGSVSGSTAGAIAGVQFAEWQTPIPTGMETGHAPLVEAAAEGAADGAASQYFEAPVESQTMKSPAEESPAAETPVVRPCPTCAEPTSHQERRHTRGAVTPRVHPAASPRPPRRILVRVP